MLAEFRITMPMTLDEYRIGQLYSVTKESVNFAHEMADNESVQFIKNEPFENESMKGQYTYKIYRIGNGLPTFILMLNPDEKALNLHEESWNAFPYCKTRVTSPASTKYLKKELLIEFTTLHCSDRGDQENVHNLSKEDLKKRRVIKIDIARPKVQGDFDLDPAKFVSEKTNRGPLDSKDWGQTVEPVMTVYKLMRFEFHWYIFNNYIREFVCKKEHQLLVAQHQKIFCWIDEWHGMTIEDIRAIEEKAKEKLEQLSSKKK